LEKAAGGEILTSMLGDLQIKKGQMEEKTPAEEENKALDG